MIDIKDLLSQGAEFEKRLKPDTTRIDEIALKMHSLISKWAILNSEGKKQEAEKQVKEIDCLDAEREKLEALNVAKVNGAFLKELGLHSKLGKQAKEFETEQLVEIDRLTIERDEAIEAFKVAREPFLAATWKIGELQKKMYNICVSLDSVSKYIPDPAIDSESNLNLQYTNKINLIGFPAVDVQVKQQAAWDNRVIPEIPPIVITNNVTEEKQYVK